MDWSTFDTRELKFLFAGFAAVAMRAQLPRLYWNQEMRDEMKNLMDSAAGVLGYEENESQKDIQEANKDDAVYMFNIQKDLLNELIRRGTH